MTLSIRWRLVGSYVLLAVLVIAVLGLTLSAILNRYFESGERRALAQSAEAIAEQASQLLAPEPDLAELRMLVASYGTLSQARLCIMDQHKRALVDSGADYGQFVQALHVSGYQIGQSRAPFVVELSPGVFVSVGSGRPSSGGGTWVRLDRPPLLSGFAIVDISSGAPPEALVRPTPSSRLSSVEVTVPVPGPRGVVGYVRISQTASYRQQILASVQQAFLLASLVAVALAIGAGLIIGGGLSAPLRALTVTTERMAAGDLAARAPVRGRDELGTLASRFNEMAARLQESFQSLAADRDQLRRFVADVSHELRTPITALSTFVELLRTSADDDPAAREEFLAECAAQVDRLDRLTVNLLELSKLDAGLIPMELAVEGVADLLERTRGRWSALAGQRGLALQLDLPADPLRVRCDRLRIEQVLDNLIGNAAKFTPAPGTIVLGAELVDSGVEFWVRDTGIGIKEQDLPFICERFYRGQSGTQAPGSGLGLAIVRAILAAHQSRLQVQSQEGQGSCFSFVLPLA